MYVITTRDRSETSKKWEKTKVIMSKCVIQMDYDDYKN